MSTIQTQAAGAGGFLLIIFLSGYWLSRSGKPYSGARLNLHKLSALAAVILFVIMLIGMNRVAALSRAELLTSVITGLLVIGLFATGALVSIAKPMPRVVLRLHHVMPYLAVLSTAAVFFLLYNRTL